MKHVKITPEIVKEHNLKPEEYEKIKELIGREPNINELGIFSVMWSEHCAYKNSKPLIKTLPTQGEQILVGPGENAGIVDIGDGLACVFKIESHNHPSAVEPYQGAATGVGGILRDIFTMGARPVALLDSLRFGKLDNERTKHLFDGVVAGIAGYGNCVGVPTVAGEVYFDKQYQENVLVNAMCVGLVEHKYITTAVASKPGYKLLYYGNTTGRDGVHGASFASAELDQDKEQRSAVQVGDPFTEKLILEATIELIQGGHVEAIQDMGAAGLTSSSTEMGGRGGCGIILYLDDIPKRADDLTAYEMLLSESQERMLAIVKPEKINDAIKVLDKWELYSTVVGEVVEGDHFKVFEHGETVVDLPISAVIEDVPQYKREVIRSSYLDELKPVDIDENINNFNEHVLKLIKSENIASKRWIYEQYDHQVQTNTVIKPGRSGAAVIRVKGTQKGISMTTDCSGRYCYLDPYNGAAMAVCEAARNIACTGAKPLAITNNLNFGNPEKSDIYYQIAESIRGMKDACTKLNTPVTGGNASLYNETSVIGAIYPTPTIGMIGVIDDYKKSVSRDFKQKGHIVYLLGNTEEELSGTEYLHVVYNQLGNNCPKVNLEHELNLINSLLELLNKTLLQSATDLSEGGLIISLIKSCLYNNVGIKFNNRTNINDQYFLFAETPGRALISFEQKHEKEIKTILEKFSIPYFNLGVTIEDTIKGPGINIDISTVFEVYENTILNLLK